MRLRSVEGLRRYRSDIIRQDFEDGSSQIQTATGIQDLNINNDLFNH